MAIKDNTKAVLAEAKRLKREKLPLAALLVERTAKQLCAVDTGTLRRSINRQVEEDRALVGSNIVYAPYVELGTRKMAARPYLRPALEANMKEIKKIFGAK